MGQYIPRPVDAYRLPLSTEQAAEVSTKYNVAVDGLVISTENFNLAGNEGDYVVFTPAGVAINNGAQFEAHYVSIEHQPE